jgi:hypothetical protein
MAEDSTRGVIDPVRRLMEMVAENKAKLGTTTNPFLEVTEQAQAAAQTAAAVLAADPATGPVEVIYLGPKDEVADRRFLLVLFGGEQAFLFDRDAGSTSPVSLDDRGITGEGRLRAKLDSAMVLAARERLSKIYLVKPPERSGARE